MATADSKVKRRSWAKIKIVTIIYDKELPVLPNNVSNKCPAIILAESRTAKVPGRITLLIVSINTIKGIKTEGVPCGTK
jgi:hypothetical protein